MSTEIQARHVRTVVTGLVGFAAALEQELLATRRAAEPGSADCWAAAPLVAHNTEFKHQQVQRLTAIAAGTTPPEFAEIDHGSAAVYQRYAALPAAAVAAGQLAGVGRADRRPGGAAGRGPARSGPAPVAARPACSGCRSSSAASGIRPGTSASTTSATASRSGRSALATRAVATAAGLEAPAAARGMASYNLACVQARAGHPDDALAALTEAVGLNPDVRANAARDPDLAGLRDSGRLAAVLA